VDTDQIGKRLLAQTALLVVGAEHGRARFPFELFCLSCGNSAGSVAANLGAPPTTSTNTRYDLHPDGVMVPPLPQVPPGVVSSVAVDKEVGAPDRGADKEVAGGTSGAALFARCFPYLCSRLVQSTNPRVAERAWEPAARGAGALDFEMAELIVSCVQRGVPTDQASIQVSAKARCSSRDLRHCFQHRLILAVTLLGRRSSRPARFRRPALAKPWSQCQSEGQFTTTLGGEPTPAVLPMAGGRE
jgi:hypothetical protein